MKVYNLPKGYGKTTKCMKRAIRLLKKKWIGMMMNRHTIQKKLLLGVKSHSLRGKIMDTTATIKDGMLTIKADKSIISFIKENIIRVMKAFTKTESINPSLIIEKLENDKDYLQYFIDHVELAYAYIGLHEMLSSL